MLERDSQQRPSKNGQPINWRRIMTLGASIGTLEMRKGCDVQIGAPPNRNK